MTEHNLGHEDTIINHYLCLTALVAEGRRDQAFAFIGTLEPAEQIDMWIAGCSITFAFAGVVGATVGVQAEDIPAWLRTFTDPGRDFEDEQ